MLKAIKPNGSRPARKRIAELYEIRNDDGTSRIEFRPLTDIAHFTMAGIFHNLELDAFAHHVLASQKRSNIVSPHDGKNLPSVD